MKKLAMVAIILFGVNGLNQIAFAGGYKTVDIHVSDAIMPTGFDSNSDAYVTEIGMFPNLCYQWSHAVVSHLPENVTEIRSYAAVPADPSVKCAMMMKPYHQDVRLGKMSPGTHLIRFINSDGINLEEQLVIE